MAKKELRPLLMPELLLLDAGLADPYSKGLAIAFSAVGLMLLQRRAEKYIAKKRIPASVSGMQSEESIEEPPPDIEYDERDPCTLPEDAQLGLAAPEQVGECIPPGDLEPIGRGVTFARGGDDPLWPVETNNKKKVRVSYKDVRGKFHGKWGRHFKTLRKGKTGTRHHAGIDLFANVGDVVQAMEDGQVIAMLPFTEGTWALYVLHDNAIVNYGELRRGSWKPFGVSTGDMISRGQRLGTVGSTAMLHLETLKPDTTVQEIRDGELQWPIKTPPPEQLLDPTQYLVNAQRLWFERKLEEELEPAPEGPPST